MEVIKWIGYILAAILVVSVVVGVGIFIAALATFGAAFVFGLCVIVVVAVLIKDCVDYVRRPSK